MLEMGRQWMYGRFFPLANKTLRVNTIRSAFLESTSWYQYAARRHAANAGYGTRCSPRSTRSPRAARPSRRCT
ncbi:hypothetical protein C8D87_11855 [Lentzea atacamensis]|uniref:Uncharacterized protein n=1 Tax=Lentzea atacamensis TaxID=531938 RepID=A0ABX9DX63_9PSEU|nr:hypothetical protein [Lentzea atacamensis]RAS58101.1 hypothetical protein C8D87_11855 [Lentzea atacamensis]